MAVCSLRFRSSSRTSVNMLYCLYSSSITWFTEMLMRCMASSGLAIRSNRADTAGTRMISAFVSASRDAVPLEDSTASCLEYPTCKVTESDTRFFSTISRHSKSIISFTISFASSKL